MTDRPLLAAFLAASCELTGFDAATLVGTGMVETYHDRVLADLGAEGLAALTAGRGEDGPAVIRLWYTGAWRGVMVSAAAYRTGLLWRAIGVPPPGSRPPGFASWTLPPNPTGWIAVLLLVLLLTLGPMPVGAADPHDLAQLQQSLRCEGCDLRGADLSRRDLVRAVLDHADLSGADLRSSLLSEIHLAGATLVDAQLQGAHLDRADLAGADLRRADLHQANLYNALASRANLNGADLEGAELTSADLRLSRFVAAHLRSAVLAGSRLAGADLRDADLRNADLRGADLRGALIDGARFCDADRHGALMPDGLAAPLAIDPC